MYQKITQPFLLALLLLTTGLVFGNPVSADMSTDQQSVAQISSPTAKVININPVQPDITEDADLTADVTAPEGVNMVNLIYTYDYNTTRVEQSMSDAPITDETPSSFEFDHTGNRVRSGNVEQRTANYTFISDYLTTASGSLDTGGGTHFVYFQVSYYDLTTSSWVIHTTKGSIDGSVDLGKTVSFSISKPMGGIALYSLSEANSGKKLPEAPTFDTDGTDGDDMSFQAQRRYTSTITAPGTATAVHFFVEGIDTKGDTFYSGNYTIYANSAPSVVEYHDLPAEVGGTTGLFLNATITDANGYTTISSVKAHYKLTSQSTWNTKELDLVRNITLTEAIYTGALNITIFEGVEEDLEFYLNITDTVAGIEQSSTESSVQTISLDNSGPVLASPISVSADPLVKNATTRNSTIGLNLTLQDSHGVADANIVYHLTNGTTYRDDLVNTTILENTDTQEEFYYTFPILKNTTTITYHFETMDYLNNNHTTKEYKLFIDGEAPVLIDLISLPSYPSNSTGATLAYNISEVSELQSHHFFYEINSTWHEVSPEPINYTNEVESTEEFALDSLPAGIKDNGTTNYTLTVKPTIEVDKATLRLSVNHNRTSDLRIYLVVGNSSVLLFDRLSESSIEVDLLNYLSLKQMKTSNITIAIEDLSIDFTGTLQSFTVNIIDYVIPLGHSYKVAIPPQDRDMTVNYYLHLTDNLGNSRNTSIQTIYLDGIPPQIANYTVYNDTIDVSGDRLLTFDASIIERGEVDSVDFYYRVNSTNTWSIAPMTEISDLRYQYDLDLENSSGYYEYHLRVFDRAGYENATAVHNFTYINANAPEIEIKTKTDEVIDLEGKTFVRIEAQISDDTDLAEVKLTYSLNGAENTTVNMVKGPQDQYIYDIEVDTKEGQISFVITAVDTNGQETVTKLMTVSYINAGVSPSVLPWLAGSLGVIALVGGVILIYRRMQQPKPAILAKTPGSKR